MNDSSGKARPRHLWPQLLPDYQAAAMSLGEHSVHGSAPFIPFTIATIAADIARWPLFVLIEILLASFHQNLQH